MVFKKQTKIKFWFIVFFLLLIGIQYSNIKPYLVANNISYSVQISAAYQQRIELENLIKKFRLNENIREDYHKGWFKYSVGSFPDYYDARSYRDNLINKHNTKGAFVVMFKDDIRMSGMDTLNEPNTPTNTNSFQQTDKKINYRIQIKTSNSKLNIDELQQNLKISEPINEEFDNGWYRYTIGYFENYDDAKNLYYRTVNIDKISDAFIVTYFGDKRIGFSSTKKTVSKIVSKKAEKSNVNVNEAQPKPDIKKDNVKKEEEEKKQQKPIKPQSEVTQKPSIIEESNFPSKIILQSSTEIQYKKAIKKPIQPNTDKKNAKIRNTETNIAQPENKTVKQTNTTSEKFVENNSEKVEKSDSIENYGTHGNFSSLTSDTSFVVRRPEKWYNKLYHTIKAQAFKDFISKFIAFLILYFILNIIIVTSIVFISRVRKVRRENRIKKIEEEYQNLLAQYLFDDLAEKQSFNKLKSISGTFRRNILIEELMKLSKDLSGEVLDKLKSLYFEIGLDKDSFRKLDNRRWYIKVKGLRELTRMKTYEAKPEIEKYINSKNSTLRAEAQLALIELNEDDPYYFLDKLKKTFLPWEQLNVHVMMQRYSYEIPDFSRWLMSENESVVLFAIEMIRVYKQIMNAPKIIRFFNHQNPLLKEASIITAGELGYIEVVPEMIKVYPEVENEYKVNILRAMQRLADENNKDFLKTILDSDAPHYIKLDAAKAMFAIGIKGQIELKQYALSNNPEIVAIVKHVFDERI